ncbi:MAG TPA: SCO2322 family protein [Candidatus Nanopelagicaceae bacterium]
MKRNHRTSILLIALAMIFSTLTLSPANAADTGYRYWGYFQAAPGDKTWTMASTGPTVVVSDGSVEGWVFTFSGDSVPDAAMPKRVPIFSRICGATKVPAAGKKRIGLVVDFGSVILRPKGETMPRSFTKCVVVDKNAIGLDVLQNRVKIRADSSGLICAFNNYPAKECGAEIPTPYSLKPKK